MLTKIRKARWALWPAMLVMATLMMLAACSHSEDVSSPPPPQTRLDEEGASSATVEDTQVEASKITGVPQPGESRDLIAFAASGGEVWSGATGPSLDSRIYYSSAVVRATFVSASDGVLTFTALEYLKGSGPTSIEVKAPTDGRNTQWDRREAILFLEPATSGGATGTSGQMQFTPAFAAESYQGTLPEGYTVDTRNPAWIPAKTSASSNSQTRTNHNPSFIIESVSPDRTTNPSITLTDLRSAIAWQTGGAGVEGYDTCILHAIGHQKFHRDYQQYRNRAWPITTERATVAAGISQGAALWIRPDRGGPNRYDKVWLTGDDADLFKAVIEDDDSLASNGFSRSVETARPLPARTYTFVSRWQNAFHVPCNYIAYNHAENLEVTVTPATGVLHDALFDPVALTSGVGVDGTNGVISAADLTVGSMSTSISGLKWENKKAVLSLSTFNSLEGYRLDFIELDGSISLSLPASSAAQDSAAKTLTWDVPSQPWHDGDLLMLRITPALGVTVSADHPSPTAGQPVIFSASIANAPAGLTPSYRWDLDLGSGSWYEGLWSDAAFKYLGNSGETAGVRVTVDYGSGLSVTSETFPISWP